MAFQRAASEIETSATNRNVADGVAPVPSEVKRQGVARLVFGGDGAGIIANVMDALERHVEPTDANVDAVRARLRAWALSGAISRRG